jgi:hypothetical protein
MSKLPLLLSSTLVLLSSLCVMPAMAEKVLSGYACSMQVHHLTNDIKWQTNLKKAEAQAEEANKPILWIHMVGKIDGAT